MVLIGFQADPSFKKEVEKKAKAEGISLSEFIRRAVSKELGRDDRYLTAKEVEEVVNRILDSRDLNFDLNKVEVVQHESTTMDPILKEALKLILTKMDSGEEPLVSEISEAVGANSRTLGMLMSLHDIQSSSVRRDGKKSRRYLMDQKEKIEKILV